MTTTAKRITVPRLATREDMEKAVGEFAAATNERDQHKAAMEQELTAVRSRFEGKMDTCEQQRDELSLALRDWADRNPDQFGKLKSIATVHGTIGWRIGQPTLKPAPKMTWAKVLETIEGFGDTLKRYLRVKTDINKEAILAERETHPAILTKIGVRVVQEETFFVDPKRDGETPAAATVAEAA